MYSYFLATWVAELFLAPSDELVMVISIMIKKESSVRVVCVILLTLVAITLS